MGVFSTNLAEIAAGALISASHTADLYKVLTGVTSETITINGSLTTTGSFAAQTASISHLTSQNNTLTSASISNANITKIVNDVVIESASISYIGNDLAVSGNITSTFIGNITGSVLGDVKGNVVGDLTGSVLGNVTGDVVGDLTGSVLGNVTGNVTGDLTGSVLGNVIGNTNGTHTGAVSATTFTTTGAITLSNLPTSNPGAAGRLWRSGSYLMVSLG